VSSRLFILPQKVQVKSRHADTLCISRRAKSGQAALGLFHVPAGGTSGGVDPFDLDNFNHEITAKEVS
jgi:hypothetical protein